MTLDEKYISRIRSLGISRSFDNVCYKGLFCKLSSYVITGRIFSLITNLNVVVNGQTFGALTINAGVPHGSLLGITLFILYINDLRV